MSDEDGGMPVLIGQQAGSNLSIKIDEDQLNDAETSHAAESVSYWILQ